MNLGMGIPISPAKTRELERMVRPSTLTPKVEELAKTDLKYHYSPRPQGGNVESSRLT